MKIEITENMKAAILQLADALKDGNQNPAEAMPIEWDAMSARAVSSVKCLLTRKFGYNLWQLRDTDVKNEVLCRMRLGDLRQYRNFGVRTEASLRHYMEERGLHFADDVTEGGEE